MPTIDILIRSEISQSIRAQQVSAMFDVPAADKCELRWSGELPIEAGDWSVGLLVGPSGSGKSTILRRTFGETQPLEWRSASVIDDFDPRHSVADIGEICQAVGFNTIPAWLRPFSVLSNGERFRVELARRMLDGGDPILVDEFTSVVDRQVAKIGSHAVQKHVRRAGHRLVAATCHYDVIDWLQPDWILDVATMQFTRRLLQRRPAVECAISRVPYASWRIFSSFHYLRNDLHRAARCFALFVGDRPAAFAGMLHRPHPRVRDIMGCSRLVTLPDWQGLGLAFALIDRIAAAYKAIGKRVNTYPAHPALIRSFDRSPCWSMVKRPGTESHTRPGMKTSDSIPLGTQGGRPNATFTYCGPAMPESDARGLLG